MSTNVKVFLMAVVGFLASTVSNLEAFNLWYVVIATVAFVLMYAAKNWLYPSNSPEGKIAWRDAISGVLIALSMAISSFAASIITLGHVDWHALWIAVVGAVVGYFLKTTPQGAKA